MYVLEIELPFFKTVSNFVESFPAGGRKFLKFILKSTFKGYELVKLFNLISFTSKPLGDFNTPPYISISDGNVIFGKSMGSSDLVTSTIAESNPAILS